MFKKDELEEFLYLYRVGERVPYHDHEDALTNFVSKLEAPFERFYNYIQGCFNSLKDEISENFLGLSKEEKLFYLNYLFDRLGFHDSKRYDTSVILKLCKELDVTTESLDLKINERLKNLLFTNYKSDYGKSISESLLKLHKEYYHYFLDLKLSEIFDYIKNCIKMIENDTDSSEKLQWIGKPSQLGVILGNLAELGYIEAPKHKSGDINYNQFAKLVKSTFQIETTEGTLSKYLNLDSEKGQETDRKFKEAKFNIPHIKEVS